MAYQSKIDQFLHAGDWPAAELEARAAIAEDLKEKVSYLGPLLGLLAEWGDGRLTILPAPLQALAAARVYDVDNTAHALDTGAFVLDRGGSALIFAPWALPAPGRVAAGIELDVTVGYGDAAIDVPEPLRQAIRLLVAHWYENRGLVTAGTATVLPSTVAALLAPYRMLTL